MIFRINGLSKQLEVHSIVRKYNAIVYNSLKLQMEQSMHSIGRNTLDRKKWLSDHKNGKRAVTHYHVLEKFW